MSYTNPFLLALQVANLPDQLDMARKLIELITLIEPLPRSDVHFEIWHTKDVPEAWVKDALKLASSRFHAAAQRSRRLGTGWPSGCNDLWQDGMDRLYQRVRDGRVPYRSVLTFEPDCIPLRPDWLNLLIEDSRAMWQHGRKAIGHMHGNPPTHINGNAIFAVDITHHYPIMHGSSGTIGWDAYHGQLLMNIGLNTRNIHQLYRIRDTAPQEIRGIRKFGRIPALFHGIKSEVGLDTVREMILTGEFDKRMEEKALDFDDAVEAYDKLPSGDGKISILVRSYQKDFRWLRYCIRGIRKNVTGADEVVLVIPTEDQLQMRAQGMGEEIEKMEHIPFSLHLWTKRHNLGYMDQQITKLHADEYCAHEFITHVDSDMIFDHQINIREALLHDNRPIVFERPWEAAKSPTVDATTWKQPTSEFLLQESPAEFMGISPMTYHRDLYGLMREFCRRQHGCELDRYIQRLGVGESWDSTQPFFSEFNTLGAMAKLYGYSKHHFQTITGKERFLQQKWSHAFDPEALDGMFLQ